MEYLFGIALIVALTYVGVEAMKHFLPSWYEKQEQRWTKNINERLDKLEASIFPEGKSND